MGNELPYGNLLSDVVRLIFRAIFVRKNADATEAVTAAEAE